MITVTGLTKQYGRRTAVDDLTFDIAAGRVTGFVGPNGAGKSTTMRMMVGLTRPDRGDVRYHGVRYARLRHPARVVGAVLDARCMHPGRSARNHLAAVAAISGIAVRRVDEVLARRPPRVHAPRIEDGADDAGRVAQPGVADAVVADLAVVGPGEADHHPHGRRLAGAVRPDEAGDPPGCDVERQVVDGDPSAVVLGEC